MDLYDRAAYKFKGGLELGYELSDIVRVAEPYLRSAYATFHALTNGNKTS